MTRIQQAEQVKAAEANGVSFHSLPLEEKSRLIELAKPMYDKWGERIGADYLHQVRAILGQ